MTSSAAAAAAVDPVEVRKFDLLAHEFWDPRGPFHPLHALNPVRLAYVAERAALSQRRVLDIGCGGGLLSEGLARHGAHVTGIDMAPAMIEVARLHAHESQIALDYELASAEQYAEHAAGPFDVITCMELIEHVPNPQSLLDAIGRLLRPGGELFISTINRNLRSFLLAIVGAEYLLKLVPRGTHEYARLLRPSELASLARGRGLTLIDVSGVRFNPLSRTAQLSRDAGINYLAHFHRQEAPA
ncbi:MAG TPA: bifunctional 2-polyprenyl-6-hydroxyphenol methylase/3-demethylubiquinol 3-O-methyltransferase UbiG [Steroidobacteraceae bacterium]|jgi:2-polyprenyl-6-hydroxyphenyl methylase/3-demethylubiquinone-9 3-methyltransferase|nr:bifunctional 2-polyprenyl-6-hydroxyphenol methylase/3-demethylubiquinol 3-O-methyltransferase UbiG [Steroidobacteraceae bacterium]